MIELKDVEITLSGKTDERFTLQGLNMKVDNEKVFLLGSNGSGKTTMLRAISGLIPYSGNIFIDGNEVRKVRNYLGYSTNLPESVMGLTVNDAVYLYEELKGLDRGIFKEMIRSLGLGDVILRRKLYSLSAGQSTIVRTALALASRPKTVGLDEPFENVDVARRHALARYIKEYGKEVLLVTHELDILKSFKEWKAYFLVGELYGPLKVSDLLESSVAEGERSDALVTFDVMGKKVSLVKGDYGMKFGELGSIDRIYGLVEE